MARARMGDTVRVHYEGRLADGTPFANSADRKPLEVKIGSHDLLPAFEEAIIGMEPGETKTLTVSAGEAFGQHSEELMRTIRREALTGETDPKVGDRLGAIDPEGESVTVTVTDVSEETITIDANHPLAGEDLTFDIMLIEIA